MSARIKYGVRHILGCDLVVYLSHGSVIFF